MVRFNLVCSPLHPLLHGCPNQMNTMNDLLVHLPTSLRSEIMLADESTRHSCSIESNCGLYKHPVLEFLQCFYTHFLLRLLTISAEFQEFLYKKITKDAFRNFLFFIHLI